MNGVYRYKGHELWKTRPLSKDKRWRLVEIGGESKISYLKEADQHDSTGKKT